MFLIFFFESKYPDLLNQSHCMKPISHPLCHLLCTTHNLWGIGCYPNPMWPASCHPILLWPSVLDYPATQECPITFSSVQSLSRVQLFTTPWTSAHQTSLSITNSQSLLKLMSTESVMPSNHLILQSFSASGSFHMSQLFTSGGQSITASASVNIQDWFPWGLTDLISL